MRRLLVYHVQRYFERLGGIWVHQHDPRCGQLDVRELCPRVSNQISTAGWYRTSQPFGDSQWKKDGKKGGGERFKHNKWKKNFNNIWYGLSDTVVIFIMNNVGERRGEKDSLMLSLIRLTWNRLISLGFPAVFKQFWLHLRKNFKKNLERERTCHSY